MAKSKATSKAKSKAPVKAKAKVAPEVEEAVETAPVEVEQEAPVEAEVEAVETEAADDEAETEVSDDEVEPEVEPEVQSVPSVSKGADTKQMSTVNTPSSPVVGQTQEALRPAAKKPREVKRGKIEDRVPLHKLNQKSIAGDRESRVRRNAQAEFVKRAVDKAFGDSPQSVLPASNAGGK